MAYKIRIASDKMNEYKDMKNMSGGMFEKYPVDMYGKRIFPDKENGKNLENAANDIKEYYKLTGEDGLNE